MDRGPVACKSNMNFKYLSNQNPQGACVVQGRAIYWRR